MTDLWMDVSSFSMQRTLAEQSGEAGLWHLGSSLSAKKFNRKKQQQQNKAKRFFSLDDRRDFFQT